MLYIVTFYLPHIVYVVLYTNNINTILLWTNYELVIAVV
jgi:hypothetical protein